MITFPPRRLFLLYGTLIQSIIINIPMVITTERLKLEIPALVPLTGLEPWHGHGCIAGMQVAIQTANSNPKLLPNFTLSLTPLDQGWATQLAPVNLIRFVSNSTNNRTTLISPALFGPIGHCSQTSNLIRGLGFVQFNGPTCDPGEVQMSAVAKAMFIFRSGWKRIAILTWNGNQINNIATFRLFSICSELGVEIVSYEVITGKTVDDRNIESLLASKVRIISLEIVEVDVVFSFFCLAHRKGMFGSRYVFLLHANAKFDLKNFQDHDLVPKHCPRSVLAQQLETSFFIGSFYEAGRFENDLTLFNAKMSQLLTSERVPDAELQPLCHNMMMEIILALHKTELELSETGLSISDFQQSYEIVKKILKKEATRLKFNSFRQQNSSTFLIAQWVNSSFQLLEKVILKDGGFPIVSNMSNELFHPKFYKIVQLKAVRWATANGEPPVDLSNLDHRFIEISLRDQGVAYFFITLSAIIQIVLLVSHRIIAKRRKNEADGSFIEATSTFPWAVFATACSALTLTSIVYVQNVTAQSSFLCSVQPFFLAMGKTAVDSFFATEIGFFLRHQRRSGINLHSIRVNSLNNHSLFSVPPTHSPARKIVKIVPSDIANLSRIIVASSITAVAIQSSIAASWFVLSPLSADLSTTPREFDPTGDTFFETVAINCDSEQMVLFAGLLVGFDSLILIIALARTLKLAPEVFAPEIEDEIQRSRVAVVNSITITAAACILLVVVDNKAIDNNAQNMMTVYLVLFYSLSNCSIRYLHLPDWKKKQNKRPHSSVCTAIGQPSAILAVNAVTGNANWHR